MHPSAYHKPSVALPPSSLLDPYCLVTEDKAGVILVEPIEQLTFRNTCPISVQARYCHVTGFPSDCVRMDKDGSFFTATVAVGRISVVEGNGHFVGSCGLIAHKGLITDTFSIYQLENWELMTRK